MSTGVRPRALFSIQRRQICPRLPAPVGIWRPTFQRLAYLGLFLAGLTLALLSSPLVSMGSWHYFQVEMVGWLLFVFGTATRWWSTLYLASGEQGKMVTAGPYSVCRNPLSLANLLLGLSFVCFLGSATVFLGFGLAAIGYLSLAVPTEERRLHAPFGDAYDGYRREVPRLWPRLRLFHSPETILVNVATLRGELWRMAIWIWIPVIGKSLAQMRAETWWPHILGLP